MSTVPKQLRFSVKRCLGKVIQEQAARRHLVRLLTRMKSFDGEELETSLRTPQRRLQCITIRDLQITIFSRQHRPYSILDDTRSRYTTCNFPDIILKNNIHNRRTPCKNLKRRERFTKMNYYKIATIRDKEIVT